MNADSVIAFNVRNPLRPTRVFCAADRAACISDVNPIFQLTKIGQTFAEIAERLARSEPVSVRDISGLSQALYEAWVQDADACLGYARLCKVGRPSICHVVHAALLVAELGAAHRLGSEQITSAIGGALTMNIAKLRLHDEMHACTDMPSAVQISEIHAHPDESVHLLGGLGKFDKSWLDAVGSHHENMDGSGYFRSLKGVEIPLLARMLRVADIFAARLTGRKKRPPLHWNILRTRTIQNIVQHIFGNDQQHLDSPLMTQLVGALGHFPPGSLVRLRNGELAVVARRIPGELASPREVLSIRDALGHVFKTPRRRRTGHGESEIRNYANDEALRFTSYDWQQVWGYGPRSDQR